MKIVSGNKTAYIPASHEDRDHPQVWKKVLATKLDIPKGQLQMVNWAKLPVGKQFQKHYHEDMHEVFVMVQGKSEMIIENKKFQLTVGDAVIVQPHEVHLMKNCGTEEVLYVVFGIATGNDGKTIVVSKP